MARASLQQYRRKRDFRRTPEPKGNASGKPFTGLFVVQKHLARRPHYDFRLELGGTLKSWAIPKGPSFNPQDKRLAVQVEDHPLEYAQFEGVIPKNQYGAGTVMLWDTGQWEPEDADPQAAYAKGHLHFTLKGSKIKGSWSLVRMHAKHKTDDNWLLIKHDDAYASELDAEDLDPNSMASQRTLEQIALDKDKVWDAGHNQVVATGHCKLQKAPRQGRKAPLPKFISPQLATLVDKPPSGKHWLQEIKYDGYRILTRVDHGHVILLSRNAKDWTNRFSAIHGSIQNIGLSSAWLDGELCFVKADGTTSFQALQNALDQNNDKPLVYFVFDLLYVNGKDLSELALLERKQILAEFLQQAGDTGSVRFADHLRGQGAVFYEQACAHHLEGIISKRADRPYHSGRGHDWLKTKCLQRQEFIIGGYTRPRGMRTGFGALLLGVYENGRLSYIGKVGTGFDELTLQRLCNTLAQLQVERSMYDIGPPKEIARAAIWVTPSLVAEIEFSDWTRDGYLRQPSFKGLRADKEPAQVRRERAQPLKSPTKPSKQAKPQAAPRTPSVAGVSLSNPDKTLYPQEAITKHELALYYEYVAERMLPFVVNRPLVLLRCPDGYTRECFFQKHGDETFPQAFSHVPISRKGASAQHLTIQSIEGLIACVQMGVLEIHTWGARADRPDRPDQLVFDLDPHEQLPWKTVIGGVQTLHALLDELGLQSFAKATGGKGLHVVVPITRRHSWPEVKSFTRAVAGALVQFDPSVYTAKVAKQVRQGKMYIDYVRNSEGATAIAPYSTRARAGAPVAVPLSWDEVDKIIAPDYFNLKNIRPRLKRLKQDPWGSYFAIRQSITKVMKKSLGIN